MENSGAQKIIAEALIRSFLEKSKKKDTAQIIAEALKQKESKIENKDTKEEVKEPETTFYNDLPLETGMAESLENIDVKIRIYEQEKIKALKIFDIEKAAKIEKKICQLRSENKRFSKQFDIGEK